MNNGGPAFPFYKGDAISGYYNIENPGMTLRDYFAAQALLMVFVVVWDHDDHINNEACAKVAYSVADAMLAERAK